MGTNTTEETVAYGGEDGDDEVDDFEDTTYICTTIRG